MKATITFFLALLISCSVYSQSDSTALDSASVKYNQYLKDIKSGKIPMVTPGGNRLGYIPSFHAFYETYLNNTNNNLNIIKPMGVPVPTRTLPDYYDMRPSIGNVGTCGPNGLVTPVEDQGQCGTCWAFSCFGSIESYFMKHCNLNEVFSEYNMVGCATVGFDGGYDGACWQGGGAEKAFAYLAKRAGPVFSTDDSKYDLTTTNFYCNSLTPRAYVTEARFINTYNETIIKQTLMEEGALDIALFWDPSGTSYYGASFDPATNNYNYQGTDAPTSNHSVTLVGWKDDFVNDDASTGAWICKNSWGTTDFGDNGYFYLAYDNNNQEEIDYVNINAPAFDGIAYFPGRIDYSPCSNVYCNDALGWTGSEPYGGQAILGQGFGTSSVFGLVKFTVTDQTQNLTKVGTWIADDNTIVNSIEIYDKFDDILLNPADMVGSLTQPQTCQYSGYYMYVVRPNCTI